MGNNEMKQSPGTKYDGGKDPVDLLPTEPLRGAAKVLAFGAKKYGEHNWRGGIQWSRLYGACLRHLFSFWDTEELDQETGLPHLDHALCCLLFLNWHFRFKKDLDDRYWSQEKEPTAGFGLTVEPQIYDLTGFMNMELASVVEELDKKECPGKATCGCETCVCEPRQDQCLCDAQDESCGAPGCEGYTPGTKSGHCKGCTNSDTPVADHTSCGHCCHSSANGSIDYFVSKRQVDALVDNHKDPSCCKGIYYCTCSDCEKARFHNGM